jgi:hypothetical protein
MLCKQPSEGKKGGRGQEVRVQDHYFEVIYFILFNAAGIFL